MRPPRPIPAARSAAGLGLAGVDADQAAYADTRRPPDADEVVDLLRWLADLCESHDLPSPVGLSLFGVPAGYPAGVEVHVDHFALWAEVLGSTVDAAVQVAGMLHVTGESDGRRIKLAAASHQELNRDDIASRGAAGIL